MIDRRFIQNFNWSLLFLVLIMITIGVVNLYSATHHSEGGEGTPVYLKQIYIAGVGFILLMIVLFFDYHLLLPLAYPLYWVSIALLLGVLLFGRAISGSQRWLTLGFVSFQPSELVKIALILALAKYFFNNELNHRYGFRDLYLPLGMVLLPALLIMKQPDLGTALLLIMLSLSVFFRNRLEDPFVSLGVVLCLPLFWFFLKDYQKKRVLIFIQPESNPLGAGYHILHAIQNRGRFRRFLGQRVPKRNPGTTPFFTRTTHRFCLFGTGRGMGFYRCLHGGHPFSALNSLGLEYRPPIQGPFRYGGLAWVSAPSSFGKAWSTWVWSSVSSRYGCPCPLSATGDLPSWPP